MRGNLAILFTTSDKYTFIFLLGLNSGFTESFLVQEGY